MADPVADPVVTIRRQVLDVAIHGAESDGLALQRRLPRLCGDVVSPAIEAALGGVFPGEDHLLIERLEIDLAIGSLDRLEVDLGSAVRQAIEEHLRRRPEPIAGAASPAGTAGTAGAAPGVRRRTAAETIDGALIAFLRTGRLPWPFRLPSGSGLDEVVLEAWATAGWHRGPPPETLDRLRQVLDDPRTRARLRLQLGPSLRLAVLGGLAPGLAGAFEEIRRAVEEAPGTTVAPAAGRAFLERVWEVALDAARSGGPADATALIRSAWAQLPPADRAATAAAALEARWPGTTGQPGRGETHRVEEAQHAVEEIRRAVEEIRRAVEEIRRAVEAAPQTAVAPAAGRAFLERAFLDRVRVAALDAARSDDPSDAAALIRRAWADLPPAERNDPTAAALEARWPGATGQPTAAPGPPDDPRSPGPPQATQAASAPGGADPPTGPGGGQPAAALSGADPPTRRRSGRPPTEPPGGADPPTRGRAAEPASSGRIPDLADEAGGILVDNAGVVLLHPFLPRFLEGVGVSAGRGLTDPARAVCLLHHVATGEHTVPEHQTTLAKVLCGLPLDEPVEADPGLTAAETEEASALLNAVIGHWGALRGTSPAALRGEFLTRPGVLSLDFDGDWLLRVETRTVDILLDQLPWGISLLRLPWMSRHLMVEWR